MNHPLLEAASALASLDKGEQVLLVRPKGVGRRFLAHALGYAAPRPGHTVRLIHADGYFRSDPDPSGKLPGAHLTVLPIPGLLNLYDRDLQSFVAQQYAGLHGLILNRHRASSPVITSNLAVGKWLDLFEDHNLDNSVLDRLANASCKITIGGSSYRERQASHWALLEATGVVDQPTAGQDCRQSEWPDGRE